MAPTLWAATLAQFRRRLTSAIYDAHFDEDNDGQAETESATDLLLDAQSKVEGALRGNYALPLSPVPRVVTKIVLDFAQVEAARRSPEIARRSPEDLEKSANEDLKMIRKNEVRLDDGSDGTEAEAEPANAGVSLEFGVSDDVPTGVGGGTFADGFGLF